MREQRRVLAHFHFDAVLELVEREARLALIIVEAHRAGDTFEAGVGQRLQKDGLPFLRAVLEIL